MSFMLTSCLLFALLTYPLFSCLTNNPGFYTLLLTQGILGILMTLHFAPMPALLSEIFPIQTRSTGMSISYSFSVILFGGFAGMIMTWLLAVTGNKLSIAYYFITCSILCATALFAARYRLKLK